MGSDTMINGNLGFMTTTTSSSSPPSSSSRLNFSQMLFQSNLLDTPPPPPPMLHHHHHSSLDHMMIGQQPERARDNNHNNIITTLQDEDDFNSTNKSDTHPPIGTSLDDDLHQLYQEGEEDDQLNDSSSQQQQPPNKKKKRYHRHTQHQIQELESFFKQCPHPDDKQRKELGRELGLKPLQVKFWFQNKRTQMKMQHERSENSQLRAENVKLRADNVRFREALTNAACPTCGGPITAGEMSYDEHQLRIENARLKEEIDRIAAIAAKYVGKPVLNLPINHLSPRPLDLEPVNYNGPGPQTTTAGTTSEIYLSNGDIPPNSIRNISPISDAEKPMIVEMAVSAMEELIQMAQMNEPLWISTAIDGGVNSTTNLLNEEEYARVFPRSVGIQPNHGEFRIEATRESGVLMMSHLNLVEILMDANQWSTIFAALVSKAMVLEVLSTGVAGTYNGALQVMTAEYQVSSPLVPTRASNFARYCKQHGDRSWAVVDFSLDNLVTGNPQDVKFRRRPSGCLFQEMPNGYLKITWVEHVEVDGNSSVHNMYEQLVNSGFAFGAKRWVATLDRQCERLASMMATTVPNGEVLTNTEGRKNMLKVTERMMVSYCAGVSGSASHSWTGISASGSEDIRVMTRKSVDDPGKPSGVILSAATSLWLPVSPKRFFDYLCNESTRNEWDILSNSGGVQGMINIANGRDAGNCASLIRVISENPSQANMLILQETCSDATACYVVYAPVDTAAMNVLLSGGNPDYVAVLPSGFAILPDRPPPPSTGGHGSGNTTTTTEGGGNINGEVGGAGSLVTVAFQILVDSDPSAKVSLGSVAIINNLIACTVGRIKTAFPGDDHTTV